MRRRAPQLSLALKFVLMVGVMSFLADFRRGRAAVTSDVLVGDSSGA